MSVQCITCSPGSGAPLETSCTPGHPTLTQGTAVPWGASTLHAAGGTHKKVLWDMQKRCPQPYVHGENRDALGAVRMQQGRIPGQVWAAFQRLLFWLSADVSSPS